MNRNVDWNSLRKNVHRNTVHANTVDLLTSQIWINEMNENIANTEGTGVEIIELDSTNNTQTSPEDPYENLQNLSHAWSYVNTNRFQDLENSYKANRQARLRRRLTNRNHTFTANDSFDSEFDDSFYFNATDNKNSTIDSADDIVTLNQQTNCFTILNKHSQLKLDSSSEDSDESDEGDMRATRCGDIVLESERYSEEVVNYNSDLEEKHTIWIYSFKNRCHLSEHESGINIPCQSTSCSTSCSPEYLDEETNTENIKHVGRVASPIPKLFIPRLNLSLTATLPNVTEVSEPKPSLAFNKNKDYPPTSAPKPANGWFLDNRDKQEYASKHDKSTNIVNWMALSPRERRRRSCHTHLDIQNVAQLLPVSEIVSLTEVKAQNSEHLDINITENNLEPEEPFQKNSQRSDDQQTENKTAIKCTMEDRGDYNKNAQRPRITFNHKQLLGSPITDPLEKLDSNNWIAENEPELLHEYNTTGNGDNLGAQGDLDLPSAGDRLMLRSMSLLKPAEWREYSSIAGSHLSLQLSLSPDSDLERTNFFQRCFSCFKCCKYRY